MILQAATEYAIRSGGLMKILISGKFLRYSRVSLIYTLLTGITGPPLP